MATVTHAFNCALADDPKAAAAGEVLISHWNATHTVTGVRTELTADTTYYVSTTGSDSNDGLSAATAWATSQHAADWISANVDAQGHNVFVQFAAGTYVGTRINSFPISCSVWVWQGVAGSIGSVTLNDSGIFSAFDIEAVSAPYLQIRNLTIDCTRSFAITFDSDHTLLALSGVNFTASGGTARRAIGMFNALTHCIIVMDQTGDPAVTVSVTGNWFSFALTGYEFSLCEFADSVTCIGTPAFSRGFIECVGGSVDFDGNLPIGAATGKRFLLANASKILGTTITTGLPGDANGLADPSCIYGGAVVPLTVSDLLGNYSPSSFKGARAFVTDSSTGISAGLGSTLVGGGSNNVPVYSDGTNWRIG